MSNLLRRLCGAMYLLRWFGNALANASGFLFGLILNLTLDLNWSPVSMQFWFELLGLIGSDHIVRAPPIEEYISGLDSALALVQSDEVCDMCKEVLVENDPRRLECGHVWCADCLVVLLRHDYTECLHCQAALFTGPKPNEAGALHLAGYLRVFSTLGLRIKVGGLVVIFVDWALRPTRPDWSSFVGLAITLYCISLDVAVLHLERGELGPLSFFGRSGQIAYLALTSLPNWWCFYNFHFIIMSMCYWLHTWVLADAWLMGWEVDQLRSGLRSVFESRLAQVAKWYSSDIRHQ